MRSGGREFLNKGTTDKGPIGSGKHGRLCLQEGGCSDQTVTSDGEGGRGPRKRANNFSFKVYGLVIIVISSDVILVCSRKYIGLK